MTVEYWYGPDTPDADVALREDLHQWMFGRSGRSKLLRVIRDPALGAYYAVWTSWGMDAYKVTL